MQSHSPVADLDEVLTTREYAAVVEVTNSLLTCTNESEFHNLIKGFASFLGYEYILYAHMQAGYSRQHPVRLVSISNPEEWMREYECEGYVELDPVRIEVEARLAKDEGVGSFSWDQISHQLSDTELAIARRRRQFGLTHGFSAYQNLPRQHSVFLISLASFSRVPNARDCLLGRLVVPHLTRCRKRLDLLSGLSTLTRQESAVAQWLTEGKTNWEIAQIMEISESTVKYHLANIFTKLGVANRQRAVAILIAASYIS